MTRYAALYCRISVDRRGRKEGVAAQERWGRTYAAEAWPHLPIRVFADNDLSAADDDVVRPEYDKLRAAIARGEIAHVWAVEQYRVERREVEWFRLAAEMDAAGITELHTNRDGIVRVQDEIAGIKAVLGAGEVRRLKRRIHDTLAEHASLGLPPGSKPYGYTHAKTADGDRTYAVVPEQAAAIRHVAQRVLDGWSFANIADELASMGHRAARGGTIGRTSLRGMVTNPTVAGYRTYHGTLTPGNWPAILDEDTWQACKVKLSAPRHVTRTDGNGTYPVGAAHYGQTAGRRYLLTGGLAVCGVCGAPMNGTMKQLRRARRFDLTALSADDRAYLQRYGRTHELEQAERYRTGQLTATQARAVVPAKPYLICHPNQGGHGCTGIMLAAVETHVTAVLFDQFDNPDFLASVAADNHADRRTEITNALAGLEAQRAELAQEWAKPGALTLTEWQAARRGLAEHESALHIELAELPPPLVNVDVTQVRQAWPSMTLDERRELVRLFIAKVSIARADKCGRGAPQFDPQRVDIEWRRR